MDEVLAHRLTLPVVPVGCRKLIVAVSVLLTIIILGVTVFFLVPRSVTPTVFNLGVGSSVNWTCMDQEVNTLTMNITWTVDIGNDNYFAVTVQDLNLTVSSIHVRWLALVDFPAGSFWFRPDSFIRSCLPGNRHSW